MKGFTERNPYLIGAVVIAFIAAATAAALLLEGGLFKSQYTVNARFSDSAGLVGGDRVRVAGVPSGTVGSISEEDGAVEVELKVDDGVELSGDTRAEIIVETLLGTKYVKLVTGDDWDTMLDDGSLITDTRTPVEVLDLQNIGTPLLEEANGPALNQLLDSLAQITEDKRADVNTIVDGLNDLTGEINVRETETRDLIDSARILADTLEGRDDDLLRAIDDLNVVVAGLAERRAELVTLLESTAEAATRTADLVGDNRPQLDAILDELHLDLEIIGRHQVDLASTLSYLGVAIEGFSSIGYSGPDEKPNQWANIFTQLVGPTDPDALFGSCGLVDDALDIALGADPADPTGTDCAARTGPLPGQQPDQASEQTTGQSAGPAVAARTGLSTAPLRGTDALDAILAPHLAPRSAPAATR